MDELKSAQNVIMYVGPRDSLSYLSYKYAYMDCISCSMSNNNKSESERLIEKFKQYEIDGEIRTER